MRVKVQAIKVPRPDNVAALLSLPIGNQNTRCTFQSSRKLRHEPQRDRKQQNAAERNVSNDPPQRSAAWSAGGGGRLTNLSAFPDQSL
jgi:hypothetical protein